MDRLSQAQRPSGNAAGTQRWTDLLFLHWEVPQTVFRPLVPKSLELDAYNGRYFVGLVPFAMSGVRPRRLPPALSLNFLETNVRTYVHYQGKDPGVYFFSLDAASKLAVEAARRIWGLPYFHADMHVANNPQNHFDYRLRRSDPRGTPGTLQVGYEAETTTRISVPGSLEHFLLERYLLFAERKSQLLLGQVHHSPYRFADAHLTHLQESLLAAANIDVDGPPSLCHYSPSVQVEVFGPNPV